MKGNRKYRYKLDTENLVFKEESVSFIGKLRKTLVFILLGGGVALILGLLLQMGLIGSLQADIIKSKNDKIVENLSKLNSKLDSVSNYLNTTQKRDDNIYRVLTDVPPLSESKRRAGFGGTNKYKYLTGYMNSELMIETAQKSDILINQLKIQSQSYDTIIYFIKQKNDSLMIVPSILPVAPADYDRISDKFGIRKHPITRKIKNHNGLDFAAQIGIPIHSTGKGKVAKVIASNKGYGNQVLIDHGYGFETRYAHMNSIDVKEGDTVKRGQKIGTVGNTGLSTGPHLHYEVILNNSHKNPEHYYVNDLTDKEYKSMIKVFCEK